MSKEIHLLFPFSRSHVVFSYISRGLPSLGAVYLSGSPFADSIFITSAPKSAINLPDVEAAINVANSTTFTPSKGLLISILPFNLFFVKLCNSHMNKIRYHNYRYCKIT